MTPPSRPHVHAVMRHIEGELEGAAGRVRSALAPDVFEQLHGAIAEARRADAGTEDPGDHYSRNPLVSIAQSAIVEHAHASTAGGPPEDYDGVQYGEHDIRWITKIFTSYVWRLLHGKHRFCRDPATLELADDRIRLVLVSDWGTGRKQAENVKVAMAEHTHADDREVHVVHLGDTYYSGTPEEAREHILDLWPVLADQAPGVGSWALLGNHEMYSGAHGFFETILADERFARQRSQHGEPTSWFCLKTPSWNILGLDTAWRDPLVEFTHGEFTGLGAVGYLEDPQTAAVADAAGDRDRKLLLLSHHQLFTAYDDRKDVGDHLLKKLQDVLDGPGVDAWFWGHEHLCVGYEPHMGVGAARAIGHAAVPQPLDRREGATPTGKWPEVFEPAPDEGLHVAWEYRGEVDDDTGKPWLKHGFAVVDVDADGLEVSYYDEHGAQVFEETIRPSR